MYYIYKFKKAIKKTKVCVPFVISQKIIKTTIKELNWFITKNVKKS